MNRLWMGMAWVVMPALAMAQPLEVDRAEVLRMGDSVEYVGGFQAEQAPTQDAFGPPASDADKWFISVVTQRGCAPCVQLKQAWRSDPWLLALANPNDPKTSWAHYNEYLRDDASQSFRWEKIRFSSFPTILVQPPRNGRYGDPRTVVFQDGYRGDPKRLASDITQAIRRYVARFNQNPPPEPGPRELEPTQVSPPWQPAPQVDPFNMPDLPPIRIPPDVVPNLFPDLGWLGQLLAVVVTAALGYLTGRRYPELLTASRPTTTRRRTKPRARTTR